MAHRRLQFVDWLAAAGQSWWQVLPLGPPNRQGSPYKAASAFAAWRGFLADPDAPVSAAERDDFRDRHGFWIDDWAAFAGGTRAINDQVRFEREWTALRVYAHERGVRLIGDVPIYVAAGSADHVRWPELFRDDVVAGVPPDAFTAKGQLWGNPIYDWGALRAPALPLVGRAPAADLPALRPRPHRPLPRPSRPTGRCRRAPATPRAGAGRAGRAARRSTPRCAELRPAAGDRRGPRGDHAGGHAPAGVARAARDGRPAVRLQPATSATASTVPERYRADQVLYTGTHDNDTLRGWYESLPPESVELGARGGRGRRASRGGG